MSPLERGLIRLLEAAPTPTPTDQPFNPVDVTPGPAGFFMTVLLMLGVGVIAMSLMRRSSRVQARFAIREELEREQAAAQAAAEEPGAAEGERPAESPDETGAAPAADPDDQDSAPRKD